MGIGFLGSTRSVPRGHVNGFQEWSVVFPGDNGILGGAQ